MSSRRQFRAGAREGALSPNLVSALGQEARSLNAVAEPADRVKAVNDFFAQLDRELDQIGNVRLQAISKLRADGWSYDRIAGATGLSKTRVAQLVKAALLT